LNLRRWRRKGEGDGADLGTGEDTKGARITTFDGGGDFRRARARRWRGWNREAERKTAREIP